MTTLVDRFTRKPESMVSDGYSDGLLVSNASNFMTTRRFLTQDNTATGVREMNVAGTLGSPVRYRIGPPAGQVWGMCLIVLAISDNANFNQTDFGAIPGPLANGIFAGFTSDGADIDIYSGFRIKQNSDWMGVPARINMTNWNGTAQTLEARFSAFEETGQYQILDGDRQQTIFLQVQDNLTALVSMKAVGRYVILKA